MEEKIRIVFVGCGEHAAETLFPSLLACHEAEVVATCDLDHARAQKLAARVGARAYLSFEKAIAEVQPDAIVAACPPQVHLALGRIAVEKGIHIFVEKPPTVWSNDLADLAQSAERQNLVTAVGHNLRHSASCRVLADEVAKPAFGKILAVETRYLVSGPRGPRWGLQPLRSFLLSHVIHALDLMISLLGSVRQVHCVSRVAKTEGSVLMATLEFSGGAVGTLLVTSCVPRFLFDVTVISENDKALHLESLRQITVYGDDEKANRWSRVWTPRTLEGGYDHSGYAVELRKFVSAIRQRTQMHPSFRDEYEVYLVIDRIENIIRQSTDV